MTSLTRTAWSCGLSQRGYAAWLALEADARTRSDGRRYIGEFDELLSAFPELEATPL